ncbi:MAG: hypothetical protein ACPGU5_00450, partial [Lishizhenia sp.]
SLAHTFLILVLLQLYKLNQNNCGKANTFNAGIFLSLAIIFNPIYFVFLPCLLLCVSVIRPFVFREYLLLLVGAFLPFLYILIFDKTFAIDQIKLNFNASFIGDMVWVLIVLVIFFVIFSIAGLIKYSATSSIRFKKLRNILLYILLFGFIGLGTMIISNGSIFYASVVVVPLSLLLPYSFLGLKLKKLLNILAWCLLVIGFAKFFI